MTTTNSLSTTTTNLPGFALDIEKRGLGLVTLKHNREGTFTVLFTHPETGLPAAFTGASPSSCAKHLYAVKKGAKSELAYRLKHGRRVPGVGGAQYWTGGRIYRRVPVLSYGGGLDSWTMLHTAVGRGEKPELVVFCDVGHADGYEATGIPGEWPGTYAHIIEVVLPYCAEHGIEFAWITNGVPSAGLKPYQHVLPIREGKADESTSLFEWFLADHLDRDPMIPGAGDCLGTQVAKVERFNSFVARRFTDGETVECWIGYDAEETSRLKQKAHHSADGELKGRRTNRFPLMEEGLCRCRCEQLSWDLGLPVPRKSACMMCGKNNKGDYLRLRRDEPVAYEAIQRLERAAHAIETGNGKHLTVLGYKGELGDSTHDQGGNLLVEEELQRSPGYRPVRKPCKVCGAKVKAVKTSGCGFLTEAERCGNGTLLQFDVGLAVQRAQKAGHASLPVLLAV